MNPDVSTGSMAGLATMLRPHLTSMLETIGLQSQATKLEIIKAVHSLFPQKKLLNWEGYFETTFVFDGQVNRFLKTIPKDFDGFGLEIEEHPSEFNLRLCLNRTPELDTKARAIFVAHKLSQNLNCKAISNCSQGMVDHPYCSLVFDKGIVFEANDSGTIWGDGEGDEVKILAPINLPIPIFDLEGNMKS